jgi:pre-mRNA-splicing helicase BRR2
MSSQLEKKMRIMGLSTSIANSKDVAEWMGITQANTFNFHPSVRPVSLEIHIQGFDNNNRESRLLSMTKPTFESISKYSKNKAAIVFCSDRKQTRLMALDLISLGTISDESTSLVSEDSERRDKRGRSMFLSVPKEQVADLLDMVKEEGLKYVLQFGVGFLHDGLLNHDKNIVRELFNGGIIQVLVVTYNLCWEISDLYSYLAVVVDPERYDGQEHRFVEYSIPVMLQMMGRTSRPAIDDSGKFIVFCHTPKKEYFKKFLYESFPVESHLDHFLHDHLNAEIIAQTIESKHDAIDWITWTFLYRRITQNPNYYNLQVNLRTLNINFYSQYLEMLLMIICPNF